MTSSCGWPLSRTSSWRTSGRAPSSNSGRVAHSGELDAAIGTWTAAHSQDEVVSVLVAADVPNGPVLTAKEIAEDPHFAERGMHERHHVRIATDDDRDVVFPGVVPRLEHRPGRTRWLGPELGADTDEALAAIGIDAAKRERLRAEGVI